MAKEKILDIIKSSKTIDSAYDIKLNKGQGTNAASATRKDYVDSQDALKVNKAGDTMTGNLTVNANINAYSIFSVGGVTANTTSTSSGLRLSSNAAGYSEIVPRRANEADFVWAGGIRYYDSNNYWTIGTNRILTDVYAPRLTSIENSLDLNTVSVPVKTMSLAHFGSAATNKPNTSNSANSVVHISTWETGTYAHQLAFSSDGKIYNRYNNNISWSDWGQVYTSIYKPNPADVGAVNKTGDVMTGVLNVPRLEISGSAAGISYGSNKNIIRSGTGTAIVIGNFSDTTYIDTLNGDVKVRPSGSTEYKIYHEGFKPTAADVNAPIKMQFDGDLNTIRTAGHYRLNTGFTNGPTGSYQYAQMLHVNGGGDTHIQIMGSYQSQNLFWRGFNNSLTAGGNWNRIYHEGSKPTPSDIGAAPFGYGLGETTTVMGSRSQFMAYSATPETGEVPYNGAGWQAAYGPTRRAQLYMGATGKLLSRFSLSSTEKDNTTPWATHYTTLNKPTADEVGASPSGYGIGEVPVLKSDANALPNVGGIFAASGAGSLNYANRYSPIIQAFRAGGSDLSGQVLQIQELSGSIVVRSRNGGIWTSWNKLYGERNRPTPGDVGAVNKTGDTMTGDLAAPTFKSTGNYAFVRTVDNEHGIFLSNTSDKRTIIGAATGGGVIELRPFGIGTTTARTTFNTDGTITSTGTPTVSGHLSTKGYVDSEVAKLLARIVALESK
ncbi:pyocin knob domain-containing protein [Aeromonas caviae]|uniref:pyocin knob domain-containing protein n=1 Tax=Aeromonas caviae TaxID=648 RepID=UPI003EC8E1DF